MRDHGKVIMSEPGIIQVVTLILACVGPLLTLWVKAKLADVHHELNSRLDQYKEDLAKKADAAEVAALARGITEGIKLVARGVAREVLETAKTEKEK